MNRKQKSLRNLLYGILSKILTLLLPFAIRTVIIYYIGIEYAGLNSLFTSILNFLSLTELGFGSTVVYILYKPMAEKDTIQIRKVLGYLKKIYRVIGLTIFAVGICIMPFLNKLISGGYPANINIYVLYFIYLLNTTVSYFIFAYKAVLFNADQRVDVINKISAIVTLISGVVEIVIIIITKNYCAYAICIPVFTVLQSLLIGIFASKRYPDYFCEGSISEAERKDVRTKVLALTGHKIGGTIVGSLDSIVISAMLGLFVLAKYSNYFMIISGLMGFINILIQSILPSIGNYLLDHDEKQSEKLFRNLNYVIVWIVGWMSVCLLCLFQPFIKIWLGEELLLDLSSVICFAVYFYSWQFRVLLANFKDAAGLWTQDVLKPYIASAVNVVLNIMLVKLIGFNGVLISTIICMFFVFFPWESIVLYKNLFKMSVVDFWISELCRLMLWTGIAFITYRICSLVEVSSEYISLVLKGIICLILPNAIYILLHFRSDKLRYVFSIVKKG